MNNEYIQILMWIKDFLHMYYILEIFFNTVDIFKVIYNDSFGRANLLTDPTLPGRVVSSESGDFLP